MSTDVVLCVPEGEAYEWMKIELIRDRVEIFTRDLTNPRLVFFERSTDPAEAVVQLRMMPASPDRLMILVFVEDGSQDRFSFMTQMIRLGRDLRDVLPASTLTALVAVVRDGEITGVRAYNPHRYGAMLDPIDQDEDLEPPTARPFAGTPVKLSRGPSDTLLAVERHKNKPS